MDYPKGESKALGGASEKVAVYEGRVQFPLRLRAADDAPAGPAEVELRVRYRACTDRACLAPATLKVPVKLTIGPR